jgi:hypothetical protein
MEILIALVIVAGLGYLLWSNNQIKPLDLNKDGKVDAQDLAAIVPVLTQSITKVADVNNDGKVDVEDAKVVVEKTKAVAKKTATKVKAVAVKAKTAVTKKPPVKK